MLDYTAPDRPRETISFRYGDFGPQIMAAGLIGEEPYSWAPACGCWQPGDVFDVRVIVHHGLSREKVEALYPSASGLRDYRYVARDEAIRYLDRSIAELRRDKDPESAEIMNREVANLTRTREAIVRALGAP
ncbi:Hypothetical protein A7982_02530 [Minicystis rosea]|nr:Hypothetical protein A7982_02530 [Minicystis rosea]